MEINNQRDDKPYKIVEIKLEDGMTCLQQGTYNEALMSSIISHEEYDRIINDSEIVISDSWIKKRKYEKVRVPKVVYLISVLVVIITIVGLIIQFYSARRKNGNTLYTTVICLTVISLIIPCGLSIYNMFRKLTVFKPLDSFIAENLGGFFKIVNRKYAPDLYFDYDNETSSVICYVKSDDSEIRPIKHDPINTEEKALMESFDGRNHNRSNSSKINRASTFTVNHKKSKVFSFDTK